MKEAPPDRSWIEFSQYGITGLGKARRVKGSCLRCGGYGGHHECLRPKHG